MLVQQSGVFGDAVGTEQTEFVVKLLAVGGNHSTLARSNMLHRVEGEHGEVGKIAIAAVLFVSFLSRKYPPGAWQASSRIHRPYSSASFLNASISKDSPQNQREQCLCKCRGGSL